MNLHQLKLHSHCWLLNQAGGEHGPYFVLREAGDLVLLARHYVSETPGGKFSQWGPPLWVDREYCILKDEKRPRLYCQSGWDWFLGAYAESMLKSCHPIEGFKLKCPTKTSNSPINRNNCSYSSGKENHTAIVSVTLKDTSEE